MPNSFLLSHTAHRVTQGLLGLGTSSNFHSLSLSHSLTHTLSLIPPCLSLRLKTLSLSSTGQVHTMKETRKYTFEESCEYVDRLLSMMTFHPTGITTFSVLIREGVCLSLPCDVNGNYNEVLKTCMHACVCVCVSVCLSL